ncbi:hypothetical protein [Streptomyces sp. NBC_00687]|uniref:hypothetical protein n=1 Tax=Streptomyces sp. NBC_00687 TaxID=2975807 RepID=UPI0022572C62|nr:hypothetical protein [Streptomyces sp. NBC_00687]MCX4920051.1 hypothetical protein [Streptomyces sp. NBC_00687]
MNTELYILLLGAVLGLVGRAAVKRAYRPLMTKLTAWLHEEFEAFLRTREM